MKTVLFSDNSLWGCFNYRGYVIRKFVDAGYRVVVAAPNDCADGFVIPESVIYEPVRISRKGTNPFKDIFYLARLLRLYRKYKPATIFHYTIKPNIYGTLIAALLGIPSVAIVTGLGYVFNNNNITARIAKMLYTFALRFSTRTIFLNEDNMALMLRMGAVKDHRAILFEGGEGVDVSSFAVEPVAEGQPRTFLMAARVLYDKGYREFVEAAKANPQARFVLVGAIDVNPSAVPEDVVRGEKAIEYLGFMSHDQLIEQMKKASCIVLPSYHEGMSIVLVEAVSLGRPIICSDIPGCRETVDEGVNGYKVPARDAEALSQACRQFAELTDDQIVTMAQASRKKAESQFDVRKVWNTYINIIDTISQ